MKTVFATVVLNDDKNKNTPFKAGSQETDIIFEITGTSTAHTIKFEVAGSSGVFVPITAFNVTDPLKMSTSTSGGGNKQPESWQVTIPPGYTFRAVPSGANGTVIIKGKAAV